MFAPPVLKARETANARIVSGHWQDLFDHQVEFEHYSRILAELPPPCATDESALTRRFVKLGIFGRVAERLVSAYGQYDPLTEGTNQVALISEVPSDPRDLKEAGRGKHMIIVQDDPLPRTFFEALTAEAEGLHYHTHSEFRLNTNILTNVSRDVFESRLTTSLGLFTPDTEKAFRAVFWDKIQTLHSLGHGLFTGESALKASVRVLAHPPIRTRKAKSDMKKRGGLHFGHQRLGNYIAGTPTILLPHPSRWSRPDNSEIARARYSLEIGPSSEDSILESLLQGRADHFTDRHSHFVDLVYHVLVNRGFFLEGLKQVPAGSYVLFNSPSDKTGVLHGVSFNFNEGRLRALMSWTDRAARE